jgi:hypothetical protein
MTDNTLFAPENSIPPASGEPMMNPPQPAFSGARPVARAPLGAGTSQGFQPPPQSGQVFPGVGGAPVMGGAPVIGPAGGARPMPKVGTAGVPSAQPPPVAGGPLPVTPGSAAAGGQPPVAGGTDPLSYEAYLASLDKSGSRYVGAGDSGERIDRAMSREAWDAMGVDGRLSQMSGGNEVDAPPDFEAAFRARFGQSPAFNPSERAGQQQTGLALGYDSGNNGVPGPQYGRADWNSYAQDPSRIMWLDPVGTPNRRYVYERANTRGDVVANEQHRESQSGLGDNAGLIMGSIVLGGGLVGGALGGGEVVAGDVIGEGGAYIDAATAADSLTPTINSAIDTSLLPPPGTTSIPDMIPPPDFGPPPADVVPPVVPPGTPGAPPAFPPETITGTPGAPPSAFPSETITGTPGTPGSPWSFDNVFTPGNVARGALTGASIAGTLAARNQANKPIPGTEGNVGTNQALNQQAQADLLDRGKPSGDQLQVINDSISQLERESTERIMQASANSGQGGSNSMLVQDKINKLHSDLALLKEQMILKQTNDNIKNALSEIGLLSNAQLALAQMAVNQSTQAQQTAMGIMQSIAWLWANS